MPDEEQLMIEVLEITQEDDKFKLVFSAGGCGGVQLFDNLESLSKSLKEQVESLFPNELPDVDMARSMECVEMIKIIRSMKLGKMNEKTAVLDFWKK